LVRADRFNWIHQTNWFGEPILNLPQDLFAIQEIIFKSRPKYIIEAGVAWGGSLLFYSTIMHALGGEKVIGIDIYIPDDLKQRIAQFGAISERIVWIHGSSIDRSVVDQVQSLLNGSREVIILLDSNHTHDHVLEELRLYSPFVGKGYYIVVGDTIVEDIPCQTHRPRPWGPGNNPKTALLQFMTENTKFKIDNDTNDKLLISCNYNGYLRCEQD
jgi:cephalosporin hydroxylase